MAELNHKTCTKCKREQTIDQFWADERYKDGYMGICRACRRENTRKYIKEHPEYKIKKSKGIKEWRKEQKILKNFDNILGGWKINIPNYTKEGEYKFNALSTKGESFRTNTFTDFIKWLHTINITKA